MRLSRALCLSLLLLSCGKPPALTPPIYAPLPAPQVDTEAPPETRLPEDTHPLRYQLTLEVDPSAVAFRGQVAIELALDRPRENIYLHARGLRVASVRVVRPSGDALTGTFARVS